MPANLLLTVQFEMESRADDVRSCSRGESLLASIDATSHPKVYVTKPNMDPTVLKWHANYQFAGTIQSLAPRLARPKEFPRGKRHNTRA